MTETMAIIKFVNLFLLGIITLLSGCASSPSLPPPPQGPDPDLSVTISPGDEVEFKFYYTPKLNELQTVRPDGMINLQLVGTIKVQGMTPLALENKLALLYKPHLKRPRPTVVIRKLIGRRVYIGGQVRKPGLISIPGSMTALEAIMEAGGFDLASAEPANVLVIRLKGNMRQVYGINIARTLAGKSSPAFYLRPSDVIFVPRTKIAKLDQWVDQYINRIIPDFTFTRQLGNSSLGIETFRRY